MAGVSVRWCVLAKYSAVATELWGASLSLLSLSLLRFTSAKLNIFKLASEMLFSGFPPLSVTTAGQEMFFKFTLMADLFLF